jgi:hypothetical protein
VTLPIDRREFLIAGGTTLGLSAFGGGADASESFLTHQPLDCSASHGYLLSLQMPPHLACSIGPEVLLPQTPNRTAQLGVALQSLRNALRIALSRFVLAVCRRGDRQQLADRLDPVLISMRVDKRQHHLARRSNSAWAKYADALRRISLARRSSATSRCTLALQVKIDSVLPCSNPLRKWSLRESRGGSPRTARMTLFPLD